MIGIKSKSLSLLWRGSWDGFESIIFHRLCNGKPNTLTVVKSTTGYIFGGYTSVAWDSLGGYTSDLTAFIFTLTNPANMPLKLKIKDQAYAVRHGAYYGPTFGKDLVIENNSNYKISYVRSDSYDAPNGKKGDAAGRFFLGGSTNEFQTVEIEVFQVCLKNLLIFYSMIWFIINFILIKIKVSSFSVNEEQSGQYSFSTKKLKKN